MNENQAEFEIEDAIDCAAARNAPLWDEMIEAEDELRRAFGEPKTPEVKP